jgi:hypothetical protein
VRLNGSATAWLLASATFGAAFVFLLSNPGDDPISAGIRIFALWGCAFATAICVVGLVITARR